MAAEFCACCTVEDNCGVSCSWAVAVYFLVEMEVVADGQADGDDQDDDDRPLAPVEDLPVVAKVELPGPLPVIHAEVP